MSELIPISQPVRQELQLNLAEFNSEPAKEDEIEIGQWFWILDEFDSRGNKREKPDWWFGCVVKVGSNFVEFKSPHGGHDRIHFDKLHTHTRRETNAIAYINDKVEKNKAEVQHWINEAREVTKRLGVRDHLRLGQDIQASASTALATCSGIVDTKAYKNALIEAKETELPAIFKKIKEATKELSIWMKADSVHLKAISNSLESSIELIDSRIFTVTLYAGISEEVVHIQSGKPAAFDERLHVMQRRHYMDEECLFDYKHGGMEFKDINKFDKWLTEEGNFDRIFPFSRCMVSFQCRRYGKIRDAFYISDYFRNVELKKLDKLTFLYIRNGENLYRLNCDLEFGHLMFGQHQSFDFSEPLMVKMKHEKVESVISKREFDEMVEEFKIKVSEYEARHKLRQTWLKDHGASYDEDGKEYIEDYSGLKNKEERCPYEWESYPYPDPREEYQLFDGNNVYFDEATKHLKNQIDQYNRIALIIQGIFDRSEMLHPHAPVKMWDGHSFNQSVKLVYDGTATMYAGDKPDFKAFVKKCNESIKVGSITIGQEYYWAKLEAEKENERRAKRRAKRYDDRGYYSEPVKVFFPRGNKGPGEVAYVAAIKNGKAIFKWQKQRQRRKNRWQRYHEMLEETIETSIAVPIDQLFNVSAYNLGDYKQFVNDPRTMAEYQNWAPTLLLAEETIAGNFDVKLNLKRSEIEKRTSDGYTRTYDGWERTVITKSKKVETKITDYGGEISHVEYIGDDEDEELEKQTDEEEE